jgi:hypothetical protein
VDTGADFSILPAKFRDQKRYVPRFNLQTASGSGIKVLGERLLRLNIGLRREFTWTFLIADVTDAILGADFLDSFKLIVDISGKRLIDSETWLAVQCPLKQTSPQTIRAVFTNAADAYQQLLRQFPNVLRSSNVPTEPHHTVLHYIETKGPPAHHRPRRLPPEKYQLAKKEFENLQRQGIIKPSSSPWASPLHLVQKADKTWRACGDFRTLNAQTVPDRYPIPHIQDFSQHLRGRTIFSTIDLVRAYYQVPVNPADQHTNSTRELLRSSARDERVLPSPVTRCGGRSSARFEMRYSTALHYEPTNPRLVKKLLNYEETSIRMYTNSHFVNFLFK